MLGIYIPSFVSSNMLCCIVACIDKANMYMLTCGKHQHMQQSQEEQQKLTVVGSVALLIAVKLTRCGGVKMAPSSVSTVLLAR